MSTSTFLKLFGTITFPATDKFVTKEMFVMNSLGRHLTLCLSQSFINLFFQKIEEHIPETTVYSSDLIEGSLNKLIIDELGGEEKAETTLAEMFYLMDKQRNGKEGSLLINGGGNIFYIRDVNQVLRVVNICRQDDGWFVYVRILMRPIRWYGKNRVFSRSH